MQVLLSISGFLYDVNCVLPHVMKYLHLWDLYCVVSAVKGHSVIVNGSNESLCLPTSYTGSCPERTDS